MTTTLSDPLNHHLSDVFRELKYGRPATCQNLLLKLADLIDELGVDQVYHMIKNIQSSDADTDTQ